MRYVILLSTLLLGTLHAEDPVLKRAEPPVAGRNLWRTSIVSLAAANALDIHSSWGKHELNQHLAGPAGKFGLQGALIKLGLQGGLIGIEWMITRGHPSGKLCRALSYINFGASAVVAGTAMHNYAVPRPR